MDVNFNTLRVQAALTLDKLIQKLNNGLLKETEYVLEKDGQGKEKWVEGNVLVSAKDIQDNVDFLRSLILTIASVYEPDDENFKEMSEEINKKGGVDRFNNTDFKNGNV